MIDNKEEMKEDAPKYYMCSCCSYRWKPRKTNGLPKNCPSCRSTVWMKSYSVRTCSRCGHVWGSTSDSPKRCPGCGTYRWNDMPTRYSCQRCGHTWISKRDWSPKRCPKCRSTTWASKGEGDTICSEHRSEKGNSTVIDAVAKRRLIEMYSAGYSCTRLSMDLCIPFSKVYDTIRERVSAERIRI
jgi:rubrerythrin